MSSGSAHQTSRGMLIIRLMQPEEGLAMGDMLTIPHQDGIREGQHLFWVGEENERMQTNWMLSGASRVLKVDRGGGSVCAII
jgi:hypothetical protein